MTDESGIERMRRALYARGGGPKERERRRLREHTDDVPTNWQHEEEPEVYTDKEEEFVEEHVGTIDPETGFPMAERDIREDVRKLRKVQKKRSLAARAIYASFFASLGFFIVALGVAALLFYNGGTSISPDNVEIKITGPVTVPGGEELVMQITITNHNTVPLELADLLVEFPSGTRSAANAAVDLPRLRESLGTIEPGERIQKTVRAILFGKENTQHAVNVAVEYHIEGSNAIFYREEPYNILLASAPLSIAVDADDEVTTGQETVIELTIQSNAKSLLKDVIVRTDYPFGFDYRSSTPAPVVGNSVWELGDVEPGSQHSIVLRGVVVGQNADERVLRFEAGSKSQNNPGEVAIAYQNTEHVFALARPFINVALLLNGKEVEDEVVVSSGGEITGQIKYKNDLSFPLHDIEFEVELSGGVLDRTSVRSTEGFYRSSDTTILFTPETTTKLTQILPGETGVLTFQFRSLALADNTTARDPALGLVINAEARRLSESNVPEVLNATVRKVAKLSTSLQLAPRAVYSVGPFTNTGPVPPQADQTTTYTIIWSVANTTNDVEDTIVSARLPLYVEWLNVVSPSSAAIAYNDVTHQIVWNVGDVPAGTGYQSKAHEVAFQISFEGSLGQVGSSPVLVENQLLRGVDRFADTVLETRPANLTTKLGSDPAYGSAQGNVLR